MTLHGLHRARTLKHKLLQLPVVMSLEVVATKSEGVCYRVIMDRQWASIVQRSVQSYLSGAKVTVKTFKPEEAVAPYIKTYRQSGHYAFPLASQSDVEEHDPIAYLTGVMDGLSANERITYQVLLIPILSREARSLSARVLRNDFQTKQFGDQSIRAAGKVGGVLSQTLFGAAELLADGFHTSTKRPSYSNGYIQTTVAPNKPVRQLSSFEQQLLQGVHDKITDPLFHASIRIGVEAPTKMVAAERLASITSALSAYDNVHYQSLRPAQFHFLKRFLSCLFLHRLPSATRRGQNIFSAAELANLYHFPLSPLNRSDNIVASLSRTLAAPLSLKQSHNFDVVIGQNSHHGVTTAIGLTEQERERHVYIIGGTGNGKTTMLQYAIVQDMQNGKGLAIVDPHGDMAEAMLRYIPPERLDDVIYFNPDDLEYPIGLNLLELTPGLMGKELLREKDLITESVVSVFRKIFSEEDTGGHRIEYVLRNTVQTALTVDGATLFTVFNLLNDPKYRRSVIKSLDNKDLINFWKNELGKAGDMQKVKMAAGITAKIGRFLFSASAKQILEQPKSTIDFDDIINSGKILICNFSKGLLGEDTSELFGITVLAKLQLASLRRARLNQAERRAFYLYVDEFQNFATASFVQMLSESRKYKLFLAMAEQSTSQQSDQQMVNIILANVGTVICFRTGNPQDEQVLLPLFGPYIGQGEISNQPAFNFYAKLSAVSAQEPLSGQTLLLKDEGRDEVMAAAIEQSRAAFAKKQEIKAETSELIKPKVSKKTQPGKKEVTAPKVEMLDL